MKSGIYIIINEEVDKIYIGQSINIDKRWGEHKRNLTSNKHPNKHLQNAYISLLDRTKLKYVLLEEIEPCKNLLNDAEKFWISYFMFLGFSIGKTLYNFQEGGDSVNHTKERRAYMSNIMMGVNRGSKHGKSILKESDINIIRYCLFKKVSMKRIATYFKISESLPMMIKLNKAWSHIKYVETEACYDLERYFYYEQMKEHIERHRKIYEKQINQTITFQVGIKTNANIKQIKISDIKKYSTVFELEFKTYFESLIDIKKKRIRILEYAEHHYSILTKTSNEFLVFNTTPGKFYFDNSHLYYQLTEASKIYAKKHNINQIKACNQLKTLAKKENITAIIIGKRWFILKDDVK